MRASSVVMTAVVAVAVAAATPAQAQKRGDRDRITCEEISRSAHRSYDLFQVIRSIRPRFLQRPPGVRSFGNSAAGSTPLAVYVDGKRDVGVEALRSIDPSRVAEVRYLDPDRSATEYGPTAAGGAILVTLLRSDAPPPGDTGKASPCGAAPG